MTSARVVSLSAAAFSAPTIAIYTFSFISSDFWLVSITLSVITATGISTAITIAKIDMMMQGVVDISFRG
jgi:hypothetical protein